MINNVVVVVVLITFSFVIFKNLYRMFLRKKANGWIK